MFGTGMKRRAYSAALCASVTMWGGAPALADADGAQAKERIITTGTHIKDPALNAASPVSSIGRPEIDMRFTPDVERILRALPSTIPAEGANVNNGAEGRASLNLRGLGPNRSLVLIDGKRVAPHDIDGVADLNSVPLNMVKRVDVVTGGASAVYGSDAISGAVNFVLRDDFDGAEFDATYAQTDKGDGGTYELSGLWGEELGGGRGNVVLGASYSEREAVRFGDRDYARVPVSVVTGNGLDGVATPPDANCTGGSAFTLAPTTEGSPTSVPATLNLRSGRALQFQDDGALATSPCAEFNFAPFNLLQTPQERLQGTALARFELTPSIEAYGRASFSANTVTQEVAPSGTFGALFTIPVANPFFSDAARQTILTTLNADAQAFLDANNAVIADPASSVAAIAAAQAALAADPNGLAAAGVIDVDQNGVFDASDAFMSTANRRTVELGPRISVFETDFYQLVGGLRGELGGGLPGWNYDVSLQYAKSDFVELRDGYTDLSGFAAAINTVSATECVDLNGVVTAGGCTPVNVFGGVGSITDEQVASGYFVAPAVDRRESEQIVFHAAVDGALPATSPLAETPVRAAFGVEYREEDAFSNPDDCLQQQPAGCQGGGAGARLPVDGQYRTTEAFVEINAPLIEGRRFAEAVTFEGGYRASSYTPQGDIDSWKAGLSWEIVPGLRLRGMQQEAVRVPNIAELFTPATIGRASASFDPCSAGNPTPPQPGEPLYDLCLSTGMTPDQIGQVADFANRLVPVFEGSNPARVPDPETGQTLTLGAVWEAEPPALLGKGAKPATVSLDYFDIEVEDYIGEPTGQEALDLCYVVGDENACAGVQRIAGSLAFDGAGVAAYFTNFEFFRSEGVDLSVETGYDFGRYGDTAITFNATRNLTNERLTTANSTVVDCLGTYSPSCEPVPELRLFGRASWELGRFDASVAWRRIGELELDESGRPFIFDEFEQIDAVNYVDLTGGVQINNTARLSGIVTNVAGEEPPVIGIGLAPAPINAANTLPSLYDALGRTVGVNLELSF